MSVKDVHIHERMQLINLQNSQVSNTNGFKGIGISEEIKRIKMYNP